MIRDITVYCSEPNGTVDRLWLSNGSEHAPESDSGVPFEEGAYRPGLPWRSPEQSEYETLFSNDPEGNPSRTIAVIKIPEAIGRVFSEIGLSRVRSEHDLKRIRKNSAEEYIDSMEAMYSFIQTFQSGEEQVFHKIGVVLNEGGKRNVTINRKNGCLTGMHLDLWDKLEISELDHATNRICINLGEQDRFFLFVNLSASTLFQLVHQNVDIDSSTVVQAQLPQLFFKYYPDYPIVKLRIKPFEAYIAPTENIVHDGNTEGQVSQDISCTVRGCFDLKAAQITRNHENLSI